MKYKTLRWAAVVSLALLLVSFGGCMVQTARLTGLEKSVAADEAKIRQMQAQIDKLKQEVKEKEKLRAAAVSRKFSYDAAQVQKSGPKIAYLTFDDGPSQNTALLLKTLKGLDVRATFFVVGTNCLKYPDAVKQEAAAGHAVGIHSWTHQYSYIYANLTNFMQDFYQLKQYLTQQLGTAPDICRFPGGTNNTVSLRYNKNHIMKQIVGQVEAADVRPIDWNASVEDAVKQKSTSNQMARRVIQQIGSQHRPVILMHDIGRNTRTIGALPQMVRQLRAEGFSFGILTAKTPAIMFPPS